MERLFPIQNNIINKFFNPMHWTILHLLIFISFGNSLNDKVDLNFLIIYPLLYERYMCNYGNDLAQG